MAEPDFDFAILGSTPLADLLAAALVKTHKSRVVLVREAPSSFRLPRGLDLSAVPATRPETWALLKPSARETVKLLARLGARGAVSRVDPVFVSETDAGAAVLSHIGFVAKGFGVELEPVKERGIASIRLRDQWLLSRAILEPALQRWHERSRIRRITLGEAAVTLQGPQARISISGEVLQARQAVLADDAAILSLLPGPVRESLFNAQIMTCVLAEPGKPLSAPLIHYIERDITFSQSAGRTRTITAYAGGSPEAVLPSVGLRLKDQAPVRRTGQTSFRVLLPVDGAPMLGPAGEGGPVLLAGLRPWGAFLVPALARWLVNKASATESAFFAARAPLGSRDIADFGPSAFLEAAA